METFLSNEGKSKSLENKTLFQDFLMAWLEKSEREIDLDEIINISCDLLDSKSIVPLRHEQINHDARTNATKAMKILIEVIFKKEQIDNFIFSLRKHAPDLFEDLKKFREEYTNPKLNDDSYLWEKREDVEMNPYANCYVVNSKVRGHILIINNEFAKDETMRRDGSVTDVLQLKRTFEDLSYRVHERTDLTKTEMLESVEDFVSNSDFHSDCHSGGLIVMSHGNNGVILDVRGDYVPVVDLLKILKGESSCLRDKPIFAIFQACRGIQEVVGNSDGMNIESFIKKNTVIKSDVRLDDEGLMKTSSASLDLKPIDFKTKPFLKDIIIMFSCFPTYLARRHSSEGAIFIQALCEVIRKYGRKLPWQGLCQKIVERDKDYQIKYNLFSAIAPEYYLYLSKNFYLDTAVRD